MDGHGRGCYERTPKGGIWHLAPPFAVKEWEDERGEITWTTREDYDTWWPHCWCGLSSRECEGLKKEEAWMWEREP